MNKGLVEDAFNGYANFALRRRVTGGTLPEPPHSARNDDHRDKEQDEVFAHEAGPAKFE